LEWALAIQHRTSEQRLIAGSERLDDVTTVSTASCDAPKIAKISKTAKSSARRITRHHSLGFDELGLALSNHSSRFQRRDRPPGSSPSARMRNGRHAERCDHPGASLSEQRVSVAERAFSQ
jgi:hypothetical protein